MHKGKSVLAVIAARGGSKGIPKKNICMAGGKPLIAWIIEAARQSACIDRLILSSDDRQIARTAQNYGCEVPFVRPVHLAGDASSSNDVVLHAIEQIPGYDYVMLLQPTSPLTRPEDIDRCIDLCISQNCPSAVSVTEVEKSPYWMFTTDETFNLTPLLGAQYLNMRRQDLPAIVMPSGALYMAQTDWFIRNQSFYSSETKGVVIPPSRSLDIDTELDLNRFELTLKQLSKGR